MNQTHDNAKTSVEHTRQGHRTLKLAILGGVVALLFAGGFTWWGLSSHADHTEVGAEAQPSHTVV